MRELKTLKRLMTDLDLNIICLTQLRTVKGTRFDKMLNAFDGENNALKWLLT